MSDTYSDMVNICYFADSKQLSVRIGLQSGGVLSGFIKFTDGEEIILTNYSTSWRFIPMSSIEYVELVGDDKLRSLARDPAELSGILVDALLGDNL